MQKSSKRNLDSYKVLCGYCPDEKCKTRLFFPAYDKSIECPGCGQRHDQATIQNVAEVTNPGVALHNILKNKLLESVKPKKGADNVKVLGLSNYVCKLISPILTYYGMDKKSGKAKLLSELMQPQIFDCGKILGDRAFLIEEENLEVTGYGRDRTGSNRYLAETLNAVRKVNNNQERLIPIHADGDGHCLVHAVSRALVGRELFWHSLRLNLMNHLKLNLSKYKELFKDYIDVNEWEDIIGECDPDFIPKDGEPLGLRNIHVFGLANVLRRPIILLDSMIGLQSPGDYSGVFLPGFVDPADCRSRDGALNKPLCIAWSSMGRNHYIPLVGVKGRPLPVLPNYMIQKSWGMPSDMIPYYIDMDESGCCAIGGEKCLSDKYIQQLVKAMEDIFYAKNKVHPQLVADTHQYMYKSAGMVGVPPSQVIQTTIQAIERSLLYRCLTCEAIMEYHLPPEWFMKGGTLYDMAVTTHGELKTDKKYSFPFHGVICSYDKERDELIPDPSKSKLSTCSFCSGDNVRVVNGDGSIHYENGDRTNTPTTSGKCTCGYKHWWDGKEYDNLPEIFPITLEWNGQVVGEKVVWFQYESDPANNSNVFEVAQAMVQKHFPGEFGSERLVQRVVDTILRQTAAHNKNKEEETSASSLSPYDDAWSADEPSKIILTGHKHKTLHKEELTKSEKEKQVRRQIQSQAAKQQQRKTQQLSSSHSPKSSPSKTQMKTSVKESTPPPSDTSSKTNSLKKVRLATSDGRQVMLTFANEVNFKELGKMIEKEVQIPVERQRIRLGFPPKELKPPPSGEEDKPIPISHGDKLMLEIISVRSASMDETETRHTSAARVNEVPPSTRLTQSWSGFDQDAHQTLDTLMQSFKDSGQGSDSVDAAVASLTIMATLKGRDLWSYVQSMPHLFSVGGLFYKQFERDLGLVDGKHCQLPALPGKVFRYNQSEDRLELCLEPYGHFPVAPNVENHAKEAPISTTETIDAFSSFSGALGRQKAKHTAFTGQGHSLATRSDDRMPRTHQESITEEPEDVQMSENSLGMGDSGMRGAEGGHTLAASSRTLGYQRLGPGFSIIDPVAMNKSNENARLFKDLAESIEKTIQEEIAEIDKEMDSLDEAEKRKSETSQNESESKDEKEAQNFSPASVEKDKTQKDVIPKDSSMIVSSEDSNMVEDMVFDETPVEQNEEVDPNVVPNKDGEKGCIDMTEQVMDDGGGEKQDKNEDSKLSCEEEMESCENSA